MLETRVGVAVVAIALVLSGCTPEAPPVDSPRASEAPADSPSSPPEPTAPSIPSMPALAGQELVTVTATATAPNGATLDLKLVTYYPVTAESPEGVQVLDYLAFVGDGSVVADPEFIADNGAVLQVSDLSVSSTSGVWPASAGVLPNLGPGKADTIVGVPAGPVVGSRLSITGPGLGYTVAALFNENGVASDPAAWADRFTYYGFTDAFANASLSACSISVSALASGAAGINRWSQQNCFIGVGD